MKKIIVFAALAAMFLISCSNEEIFNEETPAKVTTRSVMGLSKEECIQEFAKILSKVVYENQDVRAFLKDEAIKQFDNNYDILYYLIRDSQIGESTFRELLVSYSSEAIISEIEEKVPLLNIVIPPMPFTDISAESLDVSDNELPVVVNSAEGNLLYYQGRLDEIMENGAMPAFNVLVVNENVRVVINTQSSGSQKKAKRKSGYNMISFKSDAFDGMKKTRSVQVPTSEISRYQKAINAYQAGFNMDDGSSNQKAFQRDNIYYGMTPGNHQGSLNHGVSEYLDMISIDPLAYYNLSDVTVDGAPLNPEDPYMANNGVAYKRGGTLTYEEIVAQVWTKGAYTLKFELITSKGYPVIGYASVAPTDLWEFHYDITYIPGSTWKHSKRYYTLDPKKFVKKNYVLPYPINLGKWNIGEEAIQRWLHIVEIDSGNSYSYTKKYELTEVESSKISAGDKSGLGIEASDAQTKTTTITNTYNGTDKDDELGQAELNFYEPIVESYSSATGPVVRTHSTGIVEFTITAR